MNARVVLIGGSVVLLLFVANLVVASWVYRDLTPRFFEAMVPLDNLSLSAEACADCHPAIYDEWAESAHGRAFTDSLYQADLANQSAGWVCNHCHAPLLEQQPTLVEGLWSALPLIPRTRENRRFDAALQREGVTCVICHQIDGAMVGPLEGTNAPHPVTVSDELRESEACLPCHALDFPRIGSFQRPLMETHVEWEAYRAQGGESRCADCHLPLGPERAVALGGPPRPSTSHRLRGPFEDAFVQEGVEVREAVFQGGTAAVTLINHAGHRLPTAEPHRKLVVSLEALVGEVVIDSSEVWIHRPINLEELSEEPGQETTLLPGEARRIELTVFPDADVDAFRLRLTWVLWDPEDPVAQAAGLGADTLVRVLWEQRSDEIR